MAEMCLELRKEIAGAHEAYIRFATHNGANLILFLASTTIAWLGCFLLLGQNLANGTVRDQPPRDRDGEITSVQDWLAISGMTKPLLAQKWKCNGPNVPKETLVKTVKSNLVELRARRCRVHGRRGSAAPLSKPGLTAVANTAAPHQTFEGGRTYTPLAQQMERSDPEKSLVQTVVSNPLVEHRARRSSGDGDVRTLMSDHDVHTLLVERLAAAEERSTICQAEMRRR